MPHLRRRMRCRRGSSRGKILRPLPRPSRIRLPLHLLNSLVDILKPVLEEVGLALRVRGPLRQLFILLSLSPPLPLPPSELNFRCTLDRPCIIATIYVEFREEPPLSDNFVQSDMKNKGLAQDSKLASKQGSKSPVPATPQKATVKRKATSSSGSCGSGDEHGCFAPTEADADMDDYRCRIVEEPLPAPNDT